MGEKGHPDTLETELPVIIDTREEPCNHMEQVGKLLSLYGVEDEQAAETHVASEPLELKAGTWTRQIELPYNGEIKVAVGDTVQPDDVVAINHYNPPRLFVVDGFSRYKLTPQQIRASLKVQSGDSLDFDQVYAEIPPSIEVPGLSRRSRHFQSPVRGRIEFVDQNTGIMVLAEIQDYSSKPVTVNIAEKLGVKPKHIERYLTKGLGDFIYRNDVLAKRLERSVEGGLPSFVRAPNTGRITSIDKTAGTVTIAYKFTPLEFHSHVPGQVVKVVDQKSLELSYQASHLEGKIGFGRRCHGSFRILNLEDLANVSNIETTIVALNWPPTHQELKLLADNGVKGVVVYQIELTELIRFLDFEPGVINTGNELLPLSILILSGFGYRAFPVELVNTLKRYQSCFLDTHTRIRAGVVRPFIAF